VRAALCLQDRTLLLCSGVAKGKRAKGVCLATFSSLFTRLLIHGEEVLPKASPSNVELGFMFSMNLGDDANDQVTAMCSLHVGPCLI
jgi:hypothetical protein